MPGRSPSSFNSTVRLKNASSFITPVLTAADAIEFVPQMLFGLLDRVDDSCRSCRRCAALGFFDLVQLLLRIIALTEEFAAGRLPATGILGWRFALWFRRICSRPMHSCESSILRHYTFDSSTSIPLLLGMPVPCVSPPISRLDRSP